MFVVKRSYSVCTPVHGAPIIVERDVAAAAAAGYVVDGVTAHGDTLLCHGG